MRNAESIARDILVLKRGEKSNASSEEQRLVKLINKLDIELSGYLLKSHEKFITSIKANMSGTDTLGKTSLTMLNAVFKSLPDITAVSMLGKVLLSENTIDEYYVMALLYRLLENSALIIKPVPFGYYALKAGISGNKLLDFTEPLQVDAIPVFTFEDLLTALFIINDEPVGSISKVRECPALLEYKRIITEAAGMADISLKKIPDFTSYPNMALVMGLNAVRRTGKSIEFKKETLERFVMSIFKGQEVAAIF